MHMLRVFTLIGFLLIVSVAPVFGTTRLVPTDYATIQEAITAAVNSDTVLVATGQYLEHLNFLGKNIIVTSFYALDPDCSLILNTIINANGTGSAVILTSGETSDAVLMGFTITGGTGHLYEPGYGTFYVGGGIYLNNSSPTIKFNIITGNDTPDGGGGIFSDGGSPLIHRNTIVNNTTATSCGAGMLIKNATGGLVDSNYVQFNSALHGGGIALKHSNITLKRNVISHNVATADGGGIRIYTQSAPTIINNTISHNDGDGTGGAVQIIEESSPIFMNNIVSYTVGGGGVLATPGCTPDLSYNLFYENTGGDYIGVVPGLGDVTGNPAYVSGLPYDYHLTITSQAISHGNPAYAYNDPDGTRNDCGAFYYPLTVTPVVLASFSANLAPQGVSLIWTTASEIECWAWAVQRCVAGESFQDLSALIPGFGSSVEPHAYQYMDETAQAGQTYSYRLKQIDLDGSVTFSNPLSVTVNGVASGYSLQQNYPNPFNPQTSIAYSLAQAGPVSLRIYDTAGRLVADLVSGIRDAGLHTAVWNADGLPSGLYLCCLQAGGQIFNRQLALIK
jgi:parallel beta-helix repeat protein